MSDTTFVDKSLPAITASWLNEVNDHLYHDTPVAGTAVHNASAISYTPPGTGAVTHAITTEFGAQTVNVFRFMTEAQISDAIAKTKTIDLTSVIQTAIDATKRTQNLARSGAPKLYFPDGCVFRTDSTLHVDLGHIELCGGNSVIEYTGSGTAIQIGNSGYLIDLTAGYYLAGFDSIKIACTDSSAKCVVNYGYRKLALEKTYLYGGAIGLETEGCFATGVFSNSVCQNQASHGIHIKHRNNNFVFKDGAVLGADGNGVLLSTSGAELKGIKLKNMDFEGCAGAINITGNTGGVDVNGCWFENNTVYNIRVSNEIGDNNKFAISIQNNQITGAGADVLIGTTASGTLIDGVVVQGNEFVNSDLVVIGGNKVNSLTESNNVYSSTATKTLPTSGLSYVASEVQPRFSVAPTEPYGYAATGNQGEFRYSGTTGRAWIKINSGKGSGGWMLFQTQVVNDYNNNIGVLPTGSTPSALLLKSCRTYNSSPVTVTSISGGYAAQEIIIYGNDGGNTTIAHGADIRLAGGVNYTIGDNDTIHLLCVNGTKWVEVSRSNNA